MTYAETLDYLYNRLPVFHNIGVAAYKPGLDNTIRLMNVLENPQNRFHCIHIAGTNGKGSVSHFLAAIFQSAGYKVGLYTSPHLVDFGERIRVDGKMIDQQYVIEFVLNHQQVLSDIEPSFFELTMAMAFNYFAFCEVDIAIIEVGLGGRLDSTNIIQPLLSVITNISYDHIGFLGDTLQKIAAEKAGIIKPNTPVVIGESLPETLPIFQSKALEMNAPIKAVDNLMHFVKVDDKKKMIVENNEKVQFCIGLSGNYQLRNVATVFEAIAIYNKIVSSQQITNLSPSKTMNKTSKKFKPIDDNALINGLKNVVEITGLQGRWQVLQHNPMIIADTGHNVAGISYVVEQLKAQKYSNLHIVIGMVNDKDITSVLQLLPIDVTYYFTQASVVRALAANELQHKAEKFNLKGTVHYSINSAIKAALKNANKKDLIFIGGSNFVVGEAIAFLKNVKWRNIK